MSTGLTRRPRGCRISIKFKTPELEKQFEAVDDRLMILVYFIAAFVEHRFGKDLVITCVYREDGGVHNYWRGIDARTSNLTKEEGDEVAEYVNRHFIYGKPNKYCLFDERNRVSSGWSGEHFHLQVSPFDTMTIT